MSCSSGSDAAPGIGTDVEPVAVGESVSATIVSNPKPPTLEAFPDFDSDLPSTSLDLPESTDQGTEVVAEDEWLGSLEQPSSRAEWEHLAKHAHRVMQRQLSELKQFGALLKDALAAAGIDAQASAAQSFAMSQPVKLFDLTASWTVELAPDSGATDYQRYYFRNPGDGMIVGSYLVKRDANARPVRGLFAFVNPALLSDPSGSGIRIVMVAFDFAHPMRHLLAIRREYASELHPSLVSEWHEQCNAVVGTCTAEILQSDGQITSRDVFASVRFAWNESAHDVCVELSQRESDGTAVFHKVTGKSCEIAEPAWGSEPLSENDLMLGYFDTEPVGGDALSVFLDGQSHDGWNSLTADLIDGWVGGLLL